MSKLTYEDKINIYQERKQGKTVNSLAKKYGIRLDGIKYLVRLIDKHGYKILRTDKNRYYSKNEKERIINRVLVNNEAICCVVIDEGLSSHGILRNWIQNYQENGYNIVERKRGRSTMPKKPAKSQKMKQQKKK